MLESKTLTRTAADSSPCDMAGCDAVSQNHSTGPRSATTALYIAGYPLGRYCPAHTKVMRMAWLTDEALMSQRAVRVAA